MNATEQLKEEHQAIKWMLRIMSAICEQIQAGEPANTEHLEHIVEFIRVFADKCHHGKEEDLLFVAMEQAGVPKQGGPIGVMLTEHTWGRNYIQGLSQAVAAYQAGDQAAAAQIVENARGYMLHLCRIILTTGETRCPHPFMTTSTMTA